MWNQMSYDPCSYESNLLQLRMEAWKIQDFNGVRFHNCEDHSLFDYISAVKYMIYFLYNFIIHSSRAY